MLVELGQLRLLASDYYYRTKLNLILLCFMLILGGLWNCYNYCGLCVSELFRTTTDETPKWAMLSSIQFLACVAHN